jgi:hypothetical protein
LRWERDFEQMCGVSAAEDPDLFAMYCRQRQLGTHDKITVLTDGVGSGDYLAVGLLGYYGLKAAEPAVYRAGLWALPKAKAAYATTMTLLTTGGLYVHEFLTKTRPGRLAMGLFDGAQPGPIVPSRDPWYNAGLLGGQKVDEAPVIIPAARDALFGEGNE